MSQLRMQEQSDPYGLTRYSCFLYWCEDNALQRCSLHIKCFWFVPHVFARKASNLKVRKCMQSDLSQSVHCFFNGLAVNHVRHLLADCPMLLLAAKSPILQRYSFLSTTTDQKYLSFPMCLSSKVIYLSVCSRWGILSAWTRRGKLAIRRQCTNLDKSVSPVSWLNRVVSESVPVV